MNRRSLLLFPLILAALILAAACPAALAAERPNVVYIMADELGYYELSCMGNPHIQTPRVDRMASEGVRFTQALAGASVCAPTRCCLMTGKHSGHTSVRSNGGGTPMREGEETVASVLKRAGYATGGFGKWGCGGRGSTGVPEKHGFDVFLGYYDQVHAHSYYPPYIVRNSEEVPLPGNRGGSDGEDLFALRDRRGGDGSSSARTRTGRSSATCRSRRRTASSTFPIPIRPGKSTRTSRGPSQASDTRRWSRWSTGRWARCWTCCASWMSRKEHDRLLLRRQRR